MAHIAGHPQIGANPVDDGTDDPQTFKYDLYSLRRNTPDLGGRKLQDIYGRTTTLDGVTTVMPSYQWLETIKTGERTYTDTSAEDRALLAQAKADYEVAGGASSGQVSSYSRTTAGNDQYYKKWTSSATQGNEFKIAFAYKDNDYASSGNGETAHTDNSGTTHKLFDRLKFSEVHTVGHGGVGHYRRLMYYSKRITNSQLKTLTS